MTLDVFELPGADAGAVQRWSKTLPTTVIHHHKQRSGEARQALWTGEPFILAGSQSEIASWLDSLPKTEKRVLSDHGYFWILTDSGEFWHNSLQPTRPYVLDWRRREQNVVLDRTELLLRFPLIAGLSNRTHHLRQRILRIAEEPTGPWAPVLILGPSGSGKELVSQSLYELSERGRADAKKQLMVALSGAWLNIDPGMAMTEILGICGGVGTDVRERQGLLETHSAGTLFLDDFESAPRLIQEALLRITSADPPGPASFRKVGSEKDDATTMIWLLFATNGDVRELVREKHLREDFIFRMEHRVIHIHPLRMRPADIPAISRRIWAKLLQRQPGGVRQWTLPSISISGLLERDLAWEGNVRALRALLAIVASMKSMPAYFHEPVSGLMTEVMARGQRFEDWVEIVGESIFSGEPSTPSEVEVAETLRIDRAAAQNGIAGCCHLLRAELGQVVWAELSNLARGMAGKKGALQGQILARLSRELHHLRRVRRLSIEEAMELSGVSEGQARTDIKQLSEKLGEEFIIRHTIHPQGTKGKPRTIFIPGSALSTAPGKTTDLAVESTRESD